jgi:hypothetical protein
LTRLHIGASVDGAVEAVLVSALAPFLPYLLRAGQRAGEEVADELGSAAGRLAGSLWARLRPTVEASPAAREAVEDAASRPEDERARGALELQLEKLLGRDEALTRELRSLLESAKQSGVITADVVIGGSVTSDHGGVSAGRDITGGVRTGR